MPGATPASLCDEELIQRREKELRYKKWLEQVTVNAVEQALRIQLDDSPRQTQLAEESPDEQACSSAQALPCLPPIRTHCIPKSWSLDRNSEERRTIAARIYSLLVMWKPDMSFEWRARVASAVHIFERALYHEAKSKEEYLNPLMLDLQLRQILRHFEAGTGSSLLSKTSANRILTAQSKSASSTPDYFELRRRPMALGDLMKIHDASCEDSVVRHRPVTIQSVLQNEISDRDSPVMGPSELLNHLREDSEAERISLRREEADGALWEAILCGNWKDMQESLNKFSDYATKKIVKRVTVLMSKRKVEEAKKVELELRSAMNEFDAEKLAGILRRARVEYADELKTAIDDATRVLESLIREIRSDNSDDASGFAPVSSRMMDSRRIADDLGSKSVTPGTSPHRDLRHNCRLGRSITFCSRDTTQARIVGATNSRYSDLTRRFEQGRTADVDRAQFSTTRHDRHLDVRCSPSARTMSMQRRERRLLGSYLEESSESGYGWASPLRNVSSGMRGSTSTSPDEHYVGERVANFANGGVGINQTSDPVAVPVESALSSADGPRISLMSLLHQEADPESVFVLNRRRLSLGIRSNSTTSFAEELGEELADGGVDPICCVCMVGKKGAAFIPCGHTFCRKCTRELRKGRGTCPLCNRRIQDVLKIY